MASNTTGEGSGSESTGSGRRLPLSLNGSNGDENTIKEVEVKKKQTEAPAKKKEVPETKMEEGSQKSHNSKSIPASPSQNKESEQPTEDVTVGQEAGLETPKKGGSPNKEIPAEKDVEGKNADGKDVDETSDGENIPPAIEVGDEAGAEAKSRCSIM